ncbi:MAG: DUF4403 family protein [Saprospiraceae bacterium]|nr:DUF4403 family protein [Saprospiraceae bacterium]
MKHCISILLLCLIATTYQSCKTKSLPPVAATNTIDYDYNKVITEKSLITINYSLYNKGIRDTFEVIIDTIFAEEWDFPEYDIKANLKRSGQMKVELVNNQILVDLPAEITLTKDSFLGRLKANGTATLQFVSTLNIGSDWTMRTTTKLVGNQWTKKPKLTIGIANLPIETISNAAIDKVKPLIEEGIDQSIADNFDLKSTMMDVTKKMNTPIKLHDLYGGWMYMVPDTAYMTGIKNKQGISAGQIAIQAKTVVSSAKPDVTKFPKLPYLIWKNTLADTSRLSLQMDFNYSFLDSIAREKIVGQTITESGKTITVTNVKTGPLGQDLAITVTTTGSYKGDIIISGRPKYDKQLQILSVPNASVSVRTGNVLHQAAAWLLQGKIKSELQKALEFPLHDKLQLAQASIDQFIDDYYNPYNMTVTAKINKIDLSDLSPRAEKVTTTISSGMYINVLFKDLSFFR